MSGKRIVIESDDRELTSLVTMWLGDAGFEAVSDIDCNLPRRCPRSYRIIDTETRGGGTGDEGALYLVYERGEHKNELLRPFTHTELTSAVRSISYDTARELVCDPAERRVVYRGDHVTLTNKEYEIMQLLLERGESGATRDEIAAIARRQGGERETNAADVYICHLRRKLMMLTGETLIRTVRGVGYVLGK